ncbi:MULTISPECIES: M16 family metallopeptidase [Pacificibacter]|uniref:M16 family metallopeptidase n=1 Tax=Pacificibacter TaxID=1042323 RepID=UPI001C09E90E|nr:MULTISPECIES: pitrilysin family protein [Pacificibacter]MBU2935974.1 insulinase family protein [Pacificibacter marinus]MDO6615177.1 pitrilysin family protein [Pacificibacter sp. 1_MG-2023]
MKPFISVIAGAVLAISGAISPAFSQIDVQEITTEGGITAWLVEEHSIPFTALELRFQGGTTLDRAGKRGEINLMMATLEEGAADLDAQGFAKARDSLAARFDFDANTDSVSISARFLTENRDEAVALLRTAIMEPRFDPAAVDRVRGQVLSNIESNTTSPRNIASSTLNALAFGDHPYGSSPSGTIETVSGLTPEDMSTARTRALVKDRLYVSAVGDITGPELAELLDGLLGDLPQSGPELPPYVAPALTGGVTVVPFDSPQSVVMFGHSGIKRDDPDFIPAYIANEIIGGTRESRLMQEVREKRGLTYGIGSYLVSYNQSEVVLGQFSSGNAVTAQAIDVVKDEWRKLIDDGISAAELEEAKTYLTGAYALRFDGNAPIASILVGMQMSGLERDYIVHRNDLVNAVTLGDLNRVVRELYKPEELTFVVVGQPDDLKSD